MEIIINRTHVGKRSVDGSVYIGGTYVCDSTEALATRLPEGHYELTMRKCPKAARKVPCLQVPGQPGCTLCCSIHDRRCKIRLSTYDNLLQAIGQGMPDNELLLLQNEAEDCERAALRDIPQTVCHRLCTGSGVLGQGDGGILLGTSLVPGIVCNSRRAFDSLCERIRKNLERGNCVSLNISYTKPQGKINTNTKQDKQES